MMRLVFICSFFASKILFASDNYPLNNDGKKYKIVQCDSEEERKIFIVARHNAQTVNGVETTLDEETKRAMCTAGHRAPPTLDEADDRSPEHYVIKKESTKIDLKKKAKQDEFKRLMRNLQ